MPISANGAGDDAVEGALAEQPRAPAACIHDGVAALAGCDGVPAPPVRATRRAGGVGFGGAAARRRRFGRRREQRRVGHGDLAIAAVAPTNGSCIRSRGGAS